MLKMILWGIFTEILVYLAKKRGMSAERFLEIVENAVEENA